MASAKERAQKILDEIEGVKGQSGVDYRSEGFLRDCVRRDFKTLSEKQEKWLKDLETTVFGPKEKEDDEEFETKNKELTGRPTFK